MEGIKIFYRATSACVDVDEQLSKFSYSSRCEARMCDVAMTA